MNRICERTLIKFERVSAVVLGVMLFCVILLAGCVVRYPMGLSASQWDALTPEEKTKITQQQYALDAQSRAQQAALREARILREQEARAMARQQLQERRANAKYRDIVTVSLQSGIMLQRGNAYPIEPFSLNLVRGELTRIRVRARNEYHVDVPIQLGFVEDGNTVFFHANKPERIALVRRNWQRGQDYVGQSTEGPFSTYFQNLHFHIQYTPLIGEPEKIIIEHW